MVRSSQNGGNPSSAGQPTIHQVKLNESLRLQTPIDFANFRRDTVTSTTHKNQPSSATTTTAIDFFLK